MKIAVSLILSVYFCIETKSNPISETSSNGKDYTRTESIADESCADPKISLNFSNIALSSIGPNFITSPILTCLGLRGNHIRDISSKAFDKLPNLNYLDLSNNNWYDGQQILHEGGHANLKELNLDNSFNTNNYHTMFIRGSYPSLKNLYLRNNHIHNLLGNSKANFSVLTNLDLSDNIIESVRDIQNKGQYNNDFSWLPGSIKYLILDNNALGSLYITNLNNLELLSVRNNRLVSISLKKLNKLKNFSASGNRIERLSYSEFFDTPELEYLFLSDNQMKFFDGRIVDFTSSIRYLYLNKNLLTDAPEIKDSPNLQFLSLSCNQIQILEPKNFKGMKKLQFLHVDNNKIAEINADTFDSLDQLEILSLGRNKLTSLPTNWMKTLKNLRLLNLEHNLFTNVESIFFSDSDLLVTVYLQNNHLKYLKAHSLDAIPENVTIQLDSNVTYASLC